MPSNTQVSNFWVKNIKITKNFSTKTKKYRSYSPIKKKKLKRLNNHKYKI